MSWTPRQPVQESNAAMVSSASVCLEFQNKTELKSLSCFNQSLPLFRSRSSSRDRKRSRWEEEKERRSEGSFSRERSYSSLRTRDSEEASDRERERDREREAAKAEEEKDEDDLLKPAWIRCTHAESYYSNDPMDQVVR